MKHLLPLVFAGIFATTAAAQSNELAGDIILFQPADMADLSEFRWKKRPVVVFADSKNDPAYIEQMEFLEDQTEESVSYTHLTLPTSDLV